MTGAVIMAEMETARDSPAAKRRRLSLAASISQPACDLVFTDKPQPLECHPELHSLLRQVSSAERAQNHRWQ